MTRNTYSLGIDIGGTFTDVVLYGHADARVFSHKELTTPDDPTVGAIDGIARLLARERISGRQVSRVVHATTLFTNALIQRRGVKTGLITTAGFRDTLEMRREFKYDLYDLFIEMPAPLIPRALRLEAVERVTAAGQIDVPLDEDSVLRAGRELVALGVQSVAVVFLHAYANPAHEQRAREILREFPSLAVSLSCEVCPQIREYERTSTTAANAYVLPIADRYLASMEKRLRQLEIGCPLFMMLSNGGLTHAGEARRFPVQLLESGPAAGAIAAAYFGKRSGIGDVLAFDMGGTTAKLSIVEDSAPLIAYSFEAGREKRFAAGSGIPINISTVELIEVGAGGGSIARRDGMGLLKVGPQSAGSQPGPACYGSGGTEPTVTDANLVLGRINAERPIGGELSRLDVEAARLAIGKHIGEPLGLDAIAAAEAIVKVADAKMAGAIRLVSIERGYDPGRFMALPFGGGGALHVGAMIRGVGLKGAIVPRYPGVTSALGCVIADIRHNQVRTLNLDLANLDAARLDAFLVSEGREALAVVEAAGLPVERIDVLFELDMHYIGQTHTVAVPLPTSYRPEGTGINAGIVQAAFETAYRRSFSRLLQGLAVRIVSLRTAAVGRRPAFDLKALAPRGGEVEAARRGSRLVHVAGGWQETAVYSRLELPVGAMVEGPAVLEQPDATTLLDPGLFARVDDLGNLIIERGGS